MKYLFIIDDGEATLEDLLTKEGRGFNSRESLIDYIVTEKESIIKKAIEEWTSASQNIHLKPAMENV